MTELTEQTLRERCVSLFRFLRDVTTLRSTCQRSVDEYEAVLWLDDVPEEPECDSIANRPPVGDEDELDPRDQVWLEIDKPALRPPPEPPAALEPWIEVGSIDDHARERPGLRESIRLPGAEGVVERSLDAEPEVRTSFDWYVRERWLPWAIEHRRLARIQQTYATLFGMQRKQERRGEELQVAFGLGLLVWNVDGKRVRRHLVVAEAAIEIDGATGRITVGPGLDGALPSLEQDMLDPTDRPAPHHVVELERDVRALGDDVWQPERIADVCTRWANATTADSRFFETMTPPRRGSNAPEVTFAPAILLRRRSDRSLLRAFDEILTQLGQDGPVPFGIARFVDVVTEDRSFAETKPRLDRDFFPLPSNREQRLVLDRLRKQQGVLVQGPPGTGKSHTIANLICHLLATGKRVLVTSHTARALEVLRDKLPGNFSELCVMLLGAGRDALASLEQSVHAITERQQAFDIDTSESTIDELEAKLDGIRRDAASTLAELRDIEERDTVEHRLEFDDVTFEGTAMHIAETLDRQRDAHGWIEDSLDAETPFPLTDPQLATIARIAPDRRLEDVDGTPLDLAATDRVRAWFDVERRFAAYKAAPIFADLALADRERVANSAAELASTWERLRRSDAAWVRRATEDVVEGRDRTWRQLLEVTDAALGRSSGPGAKLTGMEDRPRERIEAD
ncbi:MAG: AAA family ATPase, partial [Planctomycetes bacterium]|nr:AAA family ATPase [Planctomycetota bacterium]